MKKILVSVFAFALAFCVVGCERRVLNDKTDGLYLSLEVDYNVKYDSLYNRPETFKVLFFDSETDSLVREEFVTPIGGNISVPAGMYNIIAFSMGADYTKVFTDDGWAGCYAYTDKISWNGYSGGSVIAMPDIIFSGKLENVPIPVRGDGEGVYIVHMKAATPIETGRVIVRGVKGSKYISEVTAIVDNLARAKYLSSGDVVDEAVAVPMELDINTGTGELSTVFRSFGKLPNERGMVNTLTLHIEDTGGNKFMKSFDVTDQVYACDTKDIIIIVDGSGIEIPAPGSGDSGGGLEPLIGEWDDIITPVPISSSSSEAKRMLWHNNPLRSPLEAGKLPTNRRVHLSAACDDDVAGRVNYFTDAAFTYDAGRKSWICADDYIFWPLFGTLDVLGYSSDDESLNAVWAESDCSRSVTLTGFNEALSATDDLIAACCNEARTGSSPLPLSFNHSKTLIVLKARASSENVFTINSVVFNPLETVTGNSSLTITNNGTDNETTFQWEGLTASRNEFQIGPLVVPMTENKVFSILLPEQEASSFVVNYTQSLAGGGTEEKTHTISPEVATWERGKRYVFILNFSED